MKIWVITLFPEYFLPLLQAGVVGKALRGERTSLSLELVELRHFSHSDYKGVDDPPYGGGPGMVMRADILERALLEGVVAPGQYGPNFSEKLKVIYTSPRGEQWSDQGARAMASYLEAGRDLVMVCGRYEGVDERFIQKYVDELYSLGDYILSGGEIAVMAMIDSALRFCGGTLGNSCGADDESFAQGLLEHPQYTRPREFAGLEVPEILLSGHHQRIKEYRHQEQLRLTQSERPDLYQRFLEK